MAVTRVCVLGPGGGGFHFAVEHLVSQIDGELELVLVYSIETQAAANWRSPAPVTRAFVVRSPALFADGCMRRSWLLLSAFVRAFAILVAARPDCVLAVGTALAVPFGLAARLRRVPMYFVESVTRVHRPSKTGRIVARLHLARRHYVQWPTLADERALRYEGSIIGEFATPPPRSSRTAAVVSSCEIRNTFLRLTEPNR